MSTEHSAESSEHNEITYVTHDVRQSLSSLEVSAGALLRLVNRFFEPRGVVSGFIDKEAITWTSERGPELFRGVGLSLENNEAFVFSQYRQLERIAAEQRFTVHMVQYAYLLLPTLYVVVANRAGVARTVVAFERRL